ITPPRNLGDIFVKIAQKINVQIWQKQPKIRMINFLFYEIRVCGVFVCPLCSSTLHNRYTPLLLPQ
ncbi:MAG: hypothetical protein K2N06_03505, partial [Oscillospiraceae bacterium]|nr:hypothetical protein [Oscillospiraceae bacterium]